MIDLFNTSHFIFCFASVSALVRRFYMDINKIGSIFKSSYGSLRFSIIICMEIARSTFHINYLHICANTNTFDQIHCRYNSSRVGFIRSVGRNRQKAWVPHIRRRNQPRTHRADRVGRISQCKNRKNLIGIPACNL